MQKIHTTILATLPAALAAFLSTAAAGQTCEVELIPFDGNGNEFLGSSIAFDGGRLIAGAPGELGSSASEVLGAAYVYGPTGVNGSWQHQDKLQPVTLSQRDRFATSMALDGDTLVVGAPGVTGPFEFDTGKVYVFREMAAGQWLQEALLTPSDGAVGDTFGLSVALEGDRLIVGSPAHDGGGPDLGAAYVFERSGTSWSEVQKIGPEASVSGRGFATSVALSGDRACIGGPTLTITAISGGGVSAYERDGSGSFVFSEHVQGATVAITDFYGEAVELEGDTLLVGAPNDDDGGSNAGAVYAFDYDSGSGSYIAAGKLTRAGAGSSDLLGRSLSLHGDRFISGMPGHGVGGGSATFERTGAGPWTELRSSVPTEATSGSTGQAVALFGNTGALGNPTASPIVFRDGAVYLMDVTLPDTDGNGVSDGCENWWQPYCSQSVPNSTGQFAAMTASGSPVASDQTLSVEITDLPPFQFALLVASQTQGLLPTPGGSQGDLCLGGTIGRFLDQIAGSSPAGVLAIDVPMGSLPAPLPSTVLAGETWNFQLWHRDNNPTPTANFSDAIEITFL